MTMHEHSMEGLSEARLLVQRFLAATGLLCCELHHLRLKDIHQEQGGAVWLHVSNGTTSHNVPVLTGHEQAVWDLVEQTRATRGQHHMGHDLADNPYLFSQLPHPQLSDILALRRFYAQTLYQHLLAQPGAAHEEVRREAAIQAVLQALGHQEVWDGYLAFKQEMADEEFTDERVPR